MQDELVFTTSTKSNSEFFCPSTALEPYYECQGQRLDAIEFKRKGRLETKLIFSYDLTGSNHTRLYEINLWKPLGPSIPEESPLIKKRLKKFAYFPADSGRDWQMQSMIDQNGAVSEFSYEEMALPISAGQQGFDLTQTLINGATVDLLAGAQITDPDVFFKEEIRGKFYLGLEQKTASLDHKGSSPKKILLEFKNMGNFYKIARVYSPTGLAGGDFITFHMASNGQYFVWSSNSHAQVWDLARHVPESAVFLPDLVHTPTASFTYLAGAFNDFEEVEIENTDKSVKGYSLLAFDDWFAVKSNNVEKRSTAGSPLSGAFPPRGHYPVLLR